MKKRNKKGHNIRALWAEAECLVSFKLRSGIHPQILECHIREQLRLPLCSYYSQTYLLHALRILRNLCNNDVFANFPSFQQYQDLKCDRFLLAKLKVNMYQRFSDHEYLHLKGIDSAIESRFGN
jgi:hypothetical protein